MTTRFNIPEIGTSVVLARDWTFGLYNEGRNRSLYEVMNIPYVESWRDRPSEPISVTIPQGTTLIVDRIYIRKGASDYSSISFRMPGSKTTKRTEVHQGFFTDIQGNRIPHTWTCTHAARGVRFWAKLSDVNAMVLADGVGVS